MTRRLATAVLIACLLIPGALAASVLVLGRVSDNPADHHEQLKPLLDYVVPRMADVGITEGRILMAPTVAQMASYLRSGRVDWVTETAGNGLLLGDRAGAVPLLLTERNGALRYRSLLFVAGESPIRELAGLRGARMALQSTDSTSAYLLPLMVIRDAGLPAEILPTPRDAPRPSHVGYVFANSEANIVAWVDKGFVEAGAISDLNMARLARTQPEVHARLRVVGESPWAPRAVELVRADLDGRVAARLREVLLHAARDPQAQPALKAFFGTTAFRVPTDQDRRALETLAEQSREVREAFE